MRTLDKPARATTHDAPLRRSLEDHDTNLDRSTNRESEATTMRRLGHYCALGLIMAVTAGFAGCGDQQPAVNRVGVNVVEKSAFTGSWYMARTTIDMDYEAAGLGFVGEIAGDGTAGFYGFALPRIRWVIDQETLYAYRDYEIIADPDDPWRDSAPSPDHLGTPVAAFAIQSHFDIRREYNAVTGEELNVLVENTTDQRWYDRRFMRVDWSRNLLTSYFGTSHELSEVFGETRREPAQLFVQDESQFPESWRPQFHFMTCTSPDDTSETCRPEDRDHAGDYRGPSAEGGGELYSFSFVTQEIVSPGTVNIPGWGAVPNCGEASMGMPECASVLVAVRTSFLRVSDTREYTPVEWTDERHERAGFFRLDRPTYDASRTASDPAWGFTDFSARGTNRHNIWRDWYTEDASGARSAVPYAERPVRQIVWYTTPELPAHLVEPAFQTIGEWNEVLMGTVRQLQERELPVYDRVTCQTDNPSGYCYCQCDPTSFPDGAGCVPSEALNESCAGRYDPLETPDAARARLVSGEPFDCHVVVPEGAEPNVADRAVAERLSDASYNGWFGARMEGAECVNVLRINSCNIVTEAAAEAAGERVVCQERGDIRFKFLSYVDQPGTPFLGVAQLRGDPITGEVLTGDANIGGPAMQSQRTSAMRTYDLINGRATDQEFFTGEDIRAFLEASGRVDLPAPPRIDFSVALGSGLAGDPAIRGEIDRLMGEAMDRAERLQGAEGRAAVFSDRLRDLQGSEIERRLLTNVDSLVMAGMTNTPSGMITSAMTEDIIDRASPFRNDVGEMLDEHADFNVRSGLHAFHMPNEYTDHSVMWFVAQHRDWPRARVEFELNRRLYRDTQVHEMGHCLGLLHDFGGTADTANYEDDYYRINDAYPLPDPATFDRDGTPGLGAAETQVYERAYAEARRIRELAGIDTWMNASVMDYTAQWYERIQGAGYYDRMAIRFGYGDIVDVYHNTAGIPVADINPANTRRDGIKWYRGGESCTVDTECPYAEGGSRAGELLTANRETGLMQTCESHPTVDGRSVCSNFDNDARVYAEGLSGSPEWVPVQFRYCDDIRASTRTLPWCNLFDEGDSFREIVRNSMEAYERNYIFQAFRRYRRTFSIGGYINGLLRYLFPLINIEQNLLYRYQNEPGFRDSSGAWGFDDQFLATADVMNFMARILGSPGVGAYQWNSGYQRYERFSADPASAMGQLRVDVGQGRFFGSVYQAGLTGINRIERIGSFFDKAITMQLMTARGLSPFYGPELVFYTNMYDLFPNEINQLFTGMIADQPAEYMPRVVCDEASSFPRCTDPRLVYMDFYRGDCSTPGSTTCRPHPADITYRPDPSQRLFVINGGDNFLLQSYATIFGLAQFPVYYDTSFQTQLFLCVEGTGDCNAPEGVEGVDYVRFTSNRFGKSYLAWQLTPEEGGLIDQESIAFSMVREARDSAFTLRSLQRYRGDFGGTPLDIANIPAADQARLAAMGYTIPASSTAVSDEIDRFDDRVRQLESFFGYLIQLEREYGIQFPFPYTRPEI
ncbi:MAG: hypothetical protein M3Y87_06020 [Myxococcota bacterium]|nr:hypothetical protein [Myxococcota bacterium]